MQGRRAIQALAFALAASFTGTTASAQIRINDAIEMLDAEDADQVRMGIEAIGSSDQARGVRPLAERIRRGLPAELLDLAVQTLGLLGKREAGPVLFELTNHRRVEVRVAAVEAIASCKPRGAGAALVVLLDDGDPRVRAAAALAIGQVGDRAQLDTLFLAFERGLHEAAPAIGQLANAAAADRVLGFLGRKPLDAVTPALDEILAREDVDRRTKLNVIARLEQLATPEVRTYLETMAEVLPPGPVRDEAAAAAGRITGG